MMDQLFWDMGTMCFEMLFDGLNNSETKSVQHSKQVLRERSLITTKIELMSMELDVALSEQQELERQKVFVEAHRTDLDANKEVIDYETQYGWEKEPSNNKVITTCKVCPSKTCHPGCCVSDKRNCGMMNSDGHCSVCNCHWTDHENRNYIWKKKAKRVRKSNWDDNADKKSKYNNAWSEMSRSERIIANKERELERKQEKVKTLIGVVHGCIQKLEKIALRPMVTTVGDYIDKLIDAENEKPNKDAKRVKKLKDYKKMEKIITEIQKKGGKNIPIKDLLQ